MVAVIAFLVVALYIWFDTEAFIEWTNFFHIPFISYQKYVDTKKGAMSSMINGYPDYLLLKYGNNFFVKVLGCSACLSVWLSILAAAILNVWNLLGVIILGTWVGYYGLKWLVKKAHE